MVYVEWGQGWGEQVVWPLINNSSGIQAEKPSDLGEKLM